MSLVRSRPWLQSPCVCLRRQPRREVLGAENGHRCISQEGPRTDSVLRPDFISPGCLDTPSPNFSPLTMREFNALSPPRAHTSFLTLRLFPTLFFGHPWERDAVEQVKEIGLPLDKQKPRLKGLTPSQATPSEGGEEEAKTPTGQEGRRPSHKHIHLHTLPLHWFNSCT